MSASILLVIGEDEDRHRLERALSEEGWRIIPADSGAQARQIAARESFEIAVVDNRLPDERWFNVIGAVQGPGVSTVALLPEDDTMIRTFGLELGVDYYRRLPINERMLRELVAWIKRTLRRRRMIRDESPRRLCVGDDLEIYPDLVEVRKGGQKVRLSPLEFKLLHKLAESPAGHVFSRPRLLELVWDADSGYIDEGTVTNTVNNLRHRLGDIELIETVWGFGYKLGRPVRPC